MHRSIKNTTQCALELCEYSSVGAPGDGTEAVEAEPRHAVGARARVFGHAADEELHLERLGVLVDPLVRCGLGVGL